MSDDNDSTTSGSADYVQLTSPAQQVIDDLKRQLTEANQDKYLAVRKGVEFEERLAAAEVRAADLQADLDASARDLSSTAQHVATLERRLDGADKAAERLGEMREALEKKEDERAGLEVRCDGVEAELRRTARALKEAIADGAALVRQRELEASRAKAEFEDALRDLARAKLAAAEKMHRAAEAETRRVEGVLKGVVGEPERTKTELRVHETDGDKELRQKDGKDRVDELKCGEAEPIVSEADDKEGPQQELKGRRNLLGQQLRAHPMGFRKMRQEKKEERERRIKQKIGAALREQRGKRTGFLQALSPKETQDIRQSVAEWKLVEGVDPVKVLAGMYAALKLSYTFPKNELCDLLSDLRLGPDAEAWNKGLGNDMEVVYDRIGLI